MALAEAPPVILEEGKDHYDLGLNLDILEDPTGKLTINDVNSPKWAEKFKRSEEKEPNFGFSESFFWARLKLINRKNNNESFVISQNYYLQDNITFFIKNKEKWKEIKTGDQYSFNTRDFKMRSFSFLIPPKKNLLIFLKISGSVNRFNLKLKTEKKKLRDEGNENLKYGLFFGLILSVFLYNFFIFLSSRSRSYFFYCTYVISFGLCLAIYQGYAQAYLFPNFPWVSNNGLSLMAGFSYLSVNLFSINYLKLKETPGKLLFLNNLNSIIAIAVILSSIILPYSFTVRLYVISGIYILVIIFLTGLMRALDKYRPAYYFIAAFGFVFGGIFIMFSMAGGLIPTNVLTRQASIIGNTLELILLSMGLGDRFNLIQEENINLQKNYAKNLQFEVEEKTESIKSLVENLDQGFMVINEKGIIEDGATQITNIFFHIDPVGKSIPEVLKLDKEKKEIFYKWMQNIFKGALAFQDLKRLGPQSFESNNRYIELDYRPIYVKGSKRNINKVICIATDKTHEINLEKKLELDKQNVDFINKSLQNPLEFVDLIFDSQTLIHDFKFEENGDKGELFRKFHTLKARFGQFNLKILANLINEIESAIAKEDFENIDSSVEDFDLELKDFVKKNRLIVEAANKFLVEEGNAVQVPEIIKKAQSFEDINQYIEFVKKEYLLTDLKTKFERFIPLVDEIAERQGKAINVEISGDKILVDTNKYSNFINSSIHLFRNMVDHGIESEDERIEKTKPQKGKIKVDFKSNSEGLEIILQDDGRGIDPKRLKEKAIEKGLKSEEELSHIKNENIVDMIFMPGLSTKEEVTEVSGRGVGMDAVRDEVHKLKGKINVSSKIDEGTKFVIKLPVLV